MAVSSWSPRIAKVRPPLRLSAGRFTWLGFHDRMTSLLSILVEPGFFASEPAPPAGGRGGPAAIVSGVAGVFTGIRGQSFAGHALADISSAGGAASFLF